MDREAFARVQQLFAEICDASPEQKRAALEQLRASAPELAAELARMLASDARAGEGRLDVLGRELGRAAASALAAQAGSSSPESMAEPIPEQIADFRITGVLGSGGMGTVYRAEQKSPARAVALKVLRAGASSAAALRRFELEAEVLGRLQHPGIAQIFEAGTARIDGRPQPFFAMELVPGEPLTRFARARGLDVRARLELMIKVADAVHHAHQKGVIHRDLKPANILVTDAGEPKILDFGVARLLDSDGADLPARALATQAGQVLGTLLYMSPEQVAGAPDAVDTRSDVYALGVIAYELLAGRLPHELAGKSLPEAARIVAQEEPPPLGSIDRALRGDVETIVGKALEREPARRYASAREFAADLQRHLRDETVEARPPSAAYQVGKFARRHRGLVAGLALAVAILLAALVAMSVVTARAREQAAIATSVNGLLDRLFTSPDPWASEVATASGVKVVDALGWAEAGIEESFRELPAVEASVRATLGRTYANVGELERARPHLERAYALRRELAGREDRETQRCLSELAALALRAGDLEQAERLGREAVETLRRVAGVADPATLSATGVLVNVLRSRERRDEALALARRAEEEAQAALGADDPARLRTLHNYAVMLLAAGDAAAAETRLREVVERRRVVHGEEHPLTLVSMSNLGEALWRQGRLAEAESINARVVAVRRRVLGDDHATTLQSLHARAALLDGLGRKDEALALSEQVVASATRTLGAQHPLTLDWRFALALQYQQLRRLADSEAACRELIDAERRVRPEALGDALNLLGSLLVDQGHPEEALPHLEEAVDRAEAQLPARHWITAVFRANLGNCLVLLGRFDEAESALLDSREDLESALGEKHDDTQYALAKLVLLYEKTGRMEEARELRRRLTAVGRSHAPPR